MRATFAVGRVRGGDRRVLWLAAADPRVFPGPWRVRAVVSDDEVGAPRTADAGRSTTPDVVADPNGQLALL